MIEIYCLELHIKLHTVLDTQFTKRICTKLQKGIRLLNQSY